MAGGVESPARFPILADLVEAMLAAGDPAAAAAAAEDHRRVAERLVQIPTRLKESGYMPRRRRGIP